MDHRFLHAADIHLDSPMKGLARYEGAPLEALRGATRRAFEALVQRAIDEAVAYLLLVGDLYDGDWQDYNTGLFFGAQMRRLQAAGIRVFMLAGNHDAASQITRALDLPDNVTVFSTAEPETHEVPEFGVALHGQGFADRRIDEDLTANYPTAVPGRLNIGLLHTSLDGRPGHDPYAPTSVETLRWRGYHYWALGHVHAREVVCEAPWVVFPGNLQGRHVQETGAKGATLVTVAGGAISAVQHLPLDVLRWQHLVVDVGAAEGLADVREAVQAAVQASLPDLDGRPGALRVELTGTGAVHEALHRDPQQLRAQLQDDLQATGAELWLEKLLLATRPPLDVAAALASEGAMGDLLRAVQGLDADDSALAALVDEVAELQQKLDTLLPNRPETPLTDPQALRDLLPEVQALLVERLVQGEAET